MKPPANVAAIYGEVLPRLIRRLTAARILFDRTRRARRLTLPPGGAPEPPAGFPPAHRHPHFELCFALTGRCPFLLGEERVNLQSGHMVVVSPETFHRELAADRSAPYCLLWIGFHQAGLRTHVQNHLGGGKFQHDFYADPEHPVPEALALIKTLDLELWTQPPGAVLRVQGLLLEICAHWMRTRPAGAAKPVAAARDQQRWRIEKAVQYVADHFSQPLDLAETAAYVGVTPAHLSTLFARALGRTFTDFLASCRLEEAKALLTDESLAVKEVAARVGIPNQFYFSRLFRKHLGLSPQQFRAGRTGVQKPQG